MKRDAVQVTGAGVLTINADMRVGDLQETITVTGETPIVDVQSTRRQQTISDETLKAVPATRGYNALIFLVPSVSGGSNQIDLMPAMRIFTSHGGRGNEGRTYVDGLSTGSAFNGGGASGYIIDTANSQEMQLTLSGGLGESEMGGTTVNFVPKTGGNTFSGQGFFSTAGEWSQGNNIDASLKAKGLSQPAALYKNWDVQASLGGPIVKDKLWFFANYRDFGSHDDILGMWGNLNAGKANSWNYVADPNLKARNAVARTVTAARLTAQVTPRNKIGFFIDNQLACDGSAMTQDADSCRVRGTDWVASGTIAISPEAASGAQGTAGGAFGYADSWQRVTQGTWSSPVTSHLLLEAGVSSYISKWGWMEQPGAILNLNQVQEQAAMSGVFADGTPWAAPAGLTYRALDWNFNNMQNPTTWRASASYVTGAHNMKIGYVAAYNRTDNQNHYNKTRVNYRVLNGAPNQLTMNLGEFLIMDRSQYHGFFVQDQWTVNRLTLQGAVRYDRAWSWSPEGQGATGTDLFRSAPVTFPYAAGVPGFNDITTRLGAAYDLRGNGKTSLKVNLGKYLQPANNQDRYTLMNPAGATRFARTTNRTWNDRGGLGVNGDYVPQCNMMNPAANGECGPWQQPAFGQALSAAPINPAILEGWGVRPSDWQFGASVQHEVAPRTSVEVGYYRRWFQGFTVTDNLASTPADYALYTFTAPTHPNLPGGGGYAVTSFNPRTNFSAATNYTTFTSDYGDQYQVLARRGRERELAPEERPGHPGRHEHGARRSRQLRDHGKGSRVTPHRRPRRLAAGSLLSRDGAVADADPRPGELRGSQGGRATGGHLPVQARDTRLQRQRLGHKRPVGELQLRRDERHRGHSAAEQSADGQPPPAGSAVRRLHPPGGPARGEGPQVRPHPLAHSGRRLQPVQCELRPHLPAVVRGDGLDVVLPDDAPDAALRAVQRHVRLLDSSQIGGQGLAPWPPPKSSTQNCAETPDRCAPCPDRPIQGIWSSLLLTARPRSATRAVWTARSPSSPMCWSSTTSRSSATS